MNLSAFRKILLHVFVLLTINLSTAFSQTPQPVDTISAKLKNSLLPIPVLGSSQERGVEFGLAGIYSFYLNKSSLNQRNSTINLIGSYTTKKQSKLSLTGNLWTKNNDWHILTDFRYYDFPSYFYGVGNDTKESDKDLINDKKIRLSVDAEKEVTKSFYVGAGVWYTHESISEKDELGIYNSSDLEGKSGGNITYLTLSTTFDNRDVVNYPHKGSYLRLYVQNSFKALASDFNFILTTLDARKYWQIHPNIVIAAQGYFQSLQGNDKPFFILPQLGNDMLMRGYYTGRYRDQNYLAIQSELRYRPFAKRPDAGLFSLSRGVIAAFIGGGGVFSNSNFNNETIKPNFGIGGRYIFDQRNRLTLRVDYGFGSRNKGEPQSSGFYLSLNEAF
ncbi:BamA/TamA family outer membrane protein [Solitalea sp. MAHUQ-68]|uniref:BamA/TamA family outer membrane protein n=1 Tax=Solitalea agri TaxID=2953739 RepID=A0A9X2JFI0_9SPHI|nr:BamA/TamA family outer membrane protein [Solitalea agri]MCO4293441.1 BamA/TamA family outer membrane protein [Solitalea agri]